MSDNFDLKKFLKESKAIENLNPTFKSFNDVKSNETKKSLTENIKTKLNNIPLTEDKLRERIREMILAEFESQDDEIFPVSREEDNEIDRRLSTNKDFDDIKRTNYSVNFGIDKDKEYDEIDARNRELRDKEYRDKPEFDDTYDLEDMFDNNKNYDDEDDEDEDIYEAKKDEEEVDIEDMPADEDIDLEAEPAAPEDELSAAASSATGDSKELINHLMTSLDTAKAMGNEKLTTQILNTLKFAIDQSMGAN